MNANVYFKELILQGITPMRFMMHRALEEKQAKIVSPCVDLGGGHPQAQTYLPHMTHDGKEKVVLADITPEADVYCDLEKPLPFRDGQFKTALLINVLPVIFNFASVGREVYRILDKGGRVYAWTSFNANTHPHPNDYFRYTDQALERIFKEAGFEHVEVCSYGGLGLTIGTYVGQLTQKIKIISCLIHWLSFGLNKVMDWVRPGRNARKWPMGHLVIATKQENSSRT